MNGKLDLCSSFLFIIEKNENMYLKKYKKVLAFKVRIVYTTKCCDMIAMKREVAGDEQSFSGFPWSECHWSQYCG